MNFESTFVDPRGRISRGPYVGALIILLAVFALYFFFAKGRNGEWVLATLLLPGFMLHARRLHDMGHTAWLLLVPGLPLVWAGWLVLSAPPVEPFAGAVTIVALALSAAFVLWCAVSKGQAEANRFGAPATA
jgi:uncharacterized membrane protein YhaH (DUF805 family)